MLQIIKNKIKNILLPPDPDLYYGGHYGSFSYWRLFLWNLRHPGRLYNRMRYGQLFKVKSIRKSVFKKRLLELKKNNINPENYTNNQLCYKLDELLNTLSAKQRNILKGIFPKPFPKGYEINKESISPHKI